MTDEQPKPWAVKLFWAAINAAGSGDYDAAALAIQRDFAEREAELVGALRANISVMEDALKQIAGSHYERFGVDQTDIDELPDLSADEAMNLARTTLMDTAALRSREAGHG